MMVRVERVPSSADAQGGIRGNDFDNGLRNQILYQFVVVFQSIQTAVRLIVRLGLMNEIERRVRYDGLFRIAGIDDGEKGSLSDVGFQSYDASQSAKLLFTVAAEQIKAVQG